MRLSKNFEKRGIKFDELVGHDSEKAYSSGEAYDRQEIDDIWRGFGDCAIFNTRALCDRKEFVIQSRFPKKIWRLGNIRRNPPRLVFGEQLGR